MLGNIGVFSLVRSWKLFFDLLSQCNFTLDLAFCAFLNISKTARQGGETKGPHHIHSLRSSCFINSIQRRGKPCYDREIHIPKRIWSPKSKTRQRAMSRGVTRAVFYPLIWLANEETKAFTSPISFCRSGSQTLFFGGREATTGNSSAVRRLGWDRKIRYCPLFGNRVLGVRVIRREQNSMWTLTPS